MGIPSTITAADIRDAIKRLDAGIEHGFGASHTYDVRYEGKLYPPKAVIGLAAESATGSRLPHTAFSGGESHGATNNVLRKLGFEVVNKDGEVMGGGAGSHDDGAWRADLWDRFTPAGDAPIVFSMHLLKRKDLAVEVVLDDGLRVRVDELLLTAAELVSGPEVMSRLQNDKQRGQLRRAAERALAARGDHVSLLDAGVILTAYKSDNRRTVSMNPYRSLAFDLDSILPYLGDADAAAAKAGPKSLTPTRLADEWGIDRYRVKTGIAAASRMRDIVRVLCRIPIPSSQMALYQALLEADPNPRTAPELTSQIAGNKDGAFRGITAGLATRINNTRRQTSPRGRPGLRLMFDLDTSEGPTHYTIRPELMDALGRIGLTDYLQAHSHEELEALGPKSFPFPPDVDRDPGPQPRKYWVEKSKVKDRPDRLEGPHALGKAMISPQKSRGNADIYKAMKQVLPGDVVFHLVDNQDLRGVSIVDSVADEEYDGRPFMGVEGTEWHGIPHFRVGLRDYQALSPPIDRTRFLRVELAQPVLDEAAASKRALFFNRKLEFNQGHFLTEASNVLIRLWDDLYVESGSGHLPHAGLDERQSIVPWWIFQANVKYYDLEGALAGGIQETTWLVKQHAKDIKSGDRVFLWTTGGGGIRATATVLTDPDLMFQAADPFVQDPEKFKDKATRVLIRIDRVLTPPLPRARVKANPRLEDLSILSFFQGTNFRVSGEQADLLLEMIGIGETSTLAGAHRAFSDALRAANLTFGQAEQHDAFVRAFLASLVTKRFVLLTGLSGSGKTQIGKQFGLWLGEDRQKVIPVRPDWTGPEALLGYENALSPTTDDGRKPWHVPHALRFMLGAAEHEANAHMLLLDEMNLAHVERYFADVLSGMESDLGCLPNLVEYGDEWVERPEESLIRFPANIFVIGTVNVDETTYMFSPKVLDRANTIEFRVKTTDLPLDPTALIRPGNCAEGRPADRRVLLEVAADMNWHQRHLPPWATEMVAHMRALHGLLAPHGFEFGHRVHFEAMRFAAIHSEMGGGGLLEALDLQMMQKLLPRLHGSRRRLEPVLRALGAYAMSGKKADNPGGFDPAAGDRADAVLPFSFDKIQRMTLKVRANQFASFAE